MSDSKPLLQTKPYWVKFLWYFVPLYIIDIIGIFLGIFNQILLIGGLVAAIGLLIWLLAEIIVWNSIEYEIYKNRIVIKKGIINIEKIIVRNEKIEYYKIAISLLDRIFGTGNILLFTSQIETEPEAILHDFPNIKEAEELLKEILST
ncbi:MAG: PH domain-containing protein [Promethearchaeota archaeon]